jgi:hypothetical protein
LENVSYYISNKPFSKEDYLAEKERLLKEKDKFSVEHQKIMAAA